MRKKSRNKKIKKQKCSRRKKYRHRHRYRYKTQFGGLINPKRIFNSGEEQIKQNQQNTSYLCTEKHNGYVYFIEYIVPNNFLLLKNPDSTITPKFNINRTETYVQIAEPTDNTRIKFIEYFINIRDHPDDINGWYCMMRIYGINTGLFANWSNVLFYKIPNMWFNLNVNSITIDSTLFTLVDANSELNVLQKIAKIHSGRVIKLKPNYNIYKEIKDGIAFSVLRNLRNGLLANANIKKEALHKIADLLFLGL
jgi:hypothetical protein